MKIDCVKIEDKVFISLGDLTAFLSSGLSNILDQAPSGEREIKVQLVKAIINELNTIT